MFTLDTFPNASGLQFSHLLKGNGKLLERITARIPRDNTDKVLRGSYFEPQDLLHGGPKDEALVKERGHRRIGSRGGAEAGYSRRERWTKKTHRQRNCGENIVQLGELNSRD